MNKVLTGKNSLGDAARGGASDTRLVEHNLWMLLAFVFVCRCQTISEAFDVRWNCMFAMGCRLAGTIAEEDEALHS